MKYLLLFSIFSLNALGSDSRTKIGIIDTGVPKDRYLTKWLCKGNRTDTPDTEGHATDIGLILAQEGLNYKTHCLLFIKVDFFNKNHNSEYNLGKQILDAMVFAYENNVKYLNLSFGGKGKVRGEEQILRTMLNEGVNIYVASGNDGRDLDSNCFYYPACHTQFSEYKNWKVVGYEGNNSNRGSMVKYYGDGRFCTYNHCTIGSSFATPRVMLKDILSNAF